MERNVVADMVVDGTGLLLFLRLSTERHLSTRHRFSYVSFLFPISLSTPIQPPNPPPHFPVI
ncbi:hypothetical protein BT69DRAFT_1283065 [Atractiella rhizophila]|nr:hypothetical protein BT69DRAFT_1283065 [Atractiella rhizophila]